MQTRVYLPTTTAGLRRLSADGGLRDVGMSHEDLLEFTRVDVVALVDQHVLRAVGDVDVTVVVAEGDIARIEPPVNELLRCDLRVMEAPRGHLRSADPEPATLAR